MSKRPVRTVVSEDSLKLIGIPKSFRGNTLKDFDVKGKSELKKVKGLVQAYIEDLDNNFENNKGLFLYGSNGVGKTSCQVLYLRKLIDIGIHQDVLLLLSMWINIQKCGMLRVLTRKQL